MSDEKESKEDGRTQKLYDREGRNTSSSDPKLMNARVFIGNLAAEKVTRQEIVKMFEPFGKVLGVSLHRSYGFVQFQKEECAEEAVKATDGKMVHGLKIDVKIANERRKDLPPSRHSGSGSGSSRSDRRHRRSPSPPHRSRDRHPTDRSVRWERGERGLPRSPPHGPPFPERGGRDPYFDRYPPPHVRDPYPRPRDDPYERFSRGRERYPPPRDYFSFGGPPPHEFFPPHERFPPRDYPPLPPQWRRSPEFDRGDPEREPFSLERERDWERERERRTLSGSSSSRNEVNRDMRPVDMEIIVINRQQREYAAVVSSRVQSLGLLTETQHLSPTVSLADALDNAAQRGLLYAVIITPQHDMHRSVTLTILHGRNPQEHKNMPLDDALALIRKDFELYSISSQRSMGARKAPPIPNDTSQLLRRAASGAALSSDEITAVISVLQKQKGGEERDGSHYNMGQEKETDSAKDIQRQQADLQAKILSLLGSSAVVPSSSSSLPKSPTTHSSSYTQPGTSSGSYTTSYEEERERGSSSAHYGDYSSYGYR